MIEYTNCPRCGQQSFARCEKPYAMPMVVSENGKIKINMDFAFVVRPFACGTCNYVEFLHEKNPDV